MADIFISYSKKDIEQARVIAALLEAEGYSVWWDPNLEAGDQFRKVIMKELAAAKAVVVLWTENSVDSDWVQAEADAAHSDRKVVPLKTRLLAYDRIPPPFNNLHTTNFDNHEAVLSAVAAQLAKPPSPAGIGKVVRYEALMWFGIIGSVLTLVGHWQNFIKLAHWVRIAVDNFNELVYLSFAAMFSFIGIVIDRDTSYALSFFLFMSSIAIGCGFRCGFYFSSSLGFFRALFIFYKAIIFSVVIASPILIPWSIMRNVFHVDIINYIPHSYFSINLALPEIPLQLFGIAILFIFIFHMIYGRFVFRVYGAMVYTIILVLIGDKYFYFSIKISQLGENASVFLTTLTTFMPLLIVRSVDVIRRMTYILIGLAIAIGLSELSKLIDSLSALSRNDELLSL
ncbi:toll/interleukin-1 receptor domain-containing protein [Rhodomicrobium sp. Az07]|uniref:toll/interleukin-1 receptor domain-containing protein n=1 Tax=Rhodomicrobium sp. Az07 TaxID=2839034 RepID=UPI001BEC3A15|nr:toll/interleukin-1 receptor domain-containing protein [Rhodomicrobium sp. Az07]MBT3069622.1 toll/interleukin-1 receptor domain-containing protein [Rhodomicrobium sp. Az07]